MQQVKCYGCGSTREVRTVAILGAYNDVERWFKSEHLQPDDFFVADRDDVRYVAFHCGWNEDMREGYDQVIDLGSYDTRP